MLFMEDLYIEKEAPWEFYDYVMFIVQSQITGHGNYGKVRGFSGN